MCEENTFSCTPLCGTDMATSGEGGGDEVLTAPHTWTHTDNLSSCSTAMRERPAGTGRSSVLKPSDTQWGGGAKPSTPAGKKTISGRRLQKDAILSLFADTISLVFFLPCSTVAFGIARFLSFPLIRSHSPCGCFFRQALKV